MAALISLLIERIATLDVGGRKREMFLSDSRAGLALTPTADPSRIETITSISIR